MGLKRSYRFAQEVNGRYNHLSINSIGTAYYLPLTP